MERPMLIGLVLVCIFEQVVSVSTIADCSLMRDNGYYYCKVHVDRYTCNSHTHRCEHFRYTGCGGNGNNFASMNDCYATCNTAATCGLMVPNCIQRLDTGDNGVGCLANIARFWYNSRKGRCEAFKFTGCRGNGNNFRSYLACQCKCKPKSTSCTFGEGTAGGCLDPHDPGTCDGGFSRWYYNQATRQCKSFMFGGCGGTGNRFGTRRACEELCDVPSGRNAVASASHCPRCSGCIGGAVRRPGVDARNCQLCACDICTNCFQGQTCPPNFYWRVHPIGCCACHPCPVFRCQHQCAPGTVPRSVRDRGSGCPVCKCCPDMTASRCHSSCPRNGIPTFVTRSDGCQTCVCPNPGCPPIECPDGCLYPVVRLDTRGCLLCTCSCPAPVCPPGCDKYAFGVVNGCITCECQCPDPECAADCTAPEYSINPNGCLTCRCGCPSPVCPNGCIQPQHSWKNNCLICTCRSICPNNICPYCPYGQKVWDIDSDGCSRCRCSTSSGCTLTCTGIRKCKLVWECDFPNPCGLKPKCIIE